MVAPENIMRLLPDAQPPSREELAGYFRATAEACLRHLGQRPLTLVRHVEGVTFFHKGPLPPVPDSVRRLEVVKGDGTTGTRLWVDDEAGLLGLVEIGAVELHPWGSSVADIERPDRIIFDLDPDKGLSWEAVVDAALQFREYLRGVGVESWPKTTGGKGLHLVVPIRPEPGWPQVRSLARSTAEAFADTAPDRYTPRAGAAARRGGKVFVDWLRNGRGASALGAMSPRAIAGGLISAPVSWQELEAGIDPGAFTLPAGAERFGPGKADPWLGLEPQTIPARFARLTAPPSV